MALQYGLIILPCSLCKTQYKDLKPCARQTALQVVKVFSTASCNIISILIASYCFNACAAVLTL